MIFAGEAYNVEQGVTNDVFPNERESAQECRYNATPEDHVDVNGGTRRRPTTTPSDLIELVFFMRFLGPRGLSSQSTDRGEASFKSTGCALCHTPALPTSSNVTAALDNTTANLFSDLLVHKMGNALADGIYQGFAAGDEFAPPRYGDSGSDCFSSMTVERQISWRLLPPIQVRDRKRIKLFATSTRSQPTRSRTY